MQARQLVASLVAALSLSLPVAAQIAFVAPPCPALYQSNEGLPMSITPPVAGSTMQFNGSFWLTAYPGSGPSGLPSTALAVLVLGLSTPNVTLTGCGPYSAPVGAGPCGARPSLDVVLAQSVAVTASAVSGTAGLFDVSASPTFSVQLPPGSTGLVFYSQSFVFLPPGSTQVQFAQLAPCPVLGSDVWTSNTNEITVQ